MNLNKIETIRSKIIVSINTNVSGRYDSSVDLGQLTHDIGFLNKYDNIVDYASNLFVLISKNKYFKKGNLQTALISTDFCLHRNGYYLKINEDLAVDLLKKANLSKGYEFKKILENTITVL